MYQYNPVGNTTSYTYGIDNLRKTKTVNGVTTGFIWNGSKLVAETDGNIIKTIHRYSLSGIEQSLEIETFRYRDYIKNGHGDVTYITGSDGDTLYHYDAFGNTLWSYQTSDLETSMNEDNPFQYAGEYVDDETDFIYLRNRYYAPSNGRFITEDPIKDGLNWYAYCGGNPVMMVDSLGLFDYDDKLSYGQEYNVDVSVLQHKLSDLGYLDMSQGGWGYFGPKTETAVNAYKDDMGLWNFGEYEGVVGFTTWKSLGLTYRTQHDIDAGISIVTYGGEKQYKDVSVPVKRALFKAESEFRANQWDLLWFYDQVKNKAPWDVKRKESWNNTIAYNTYPGSASTEVILNGIITTPEGIGNITYGYLGMAAGYTPEILLKGGDAAASGVNLSVNGIINGVEGILKGADSKEDKLNILLGTMWYNGG